MKERRLRSLPIMAGIFIFQGSALSQVNVWTYHYDLARTGANTNEVLLNLGTVNSAGFGKLFTRTLDGNVYAQPLYISALSLPGQGIHNVVFAATQHNSVYAFDADSSAGPNGGLLWTVNLGPSAATPNPDFGNRFGGFVEISPEVGITGTPVIDTNSGTLYVDAFTHEGSSYFHRVHALDITTGAERSFSPVLVNASVPGAGVGGNDGIVIFDPKQQLQRSALTLAGGIVYVNYASYAITDPYHGWVLGFNGGSLQLSPSYIFNDSPNGTIAQYGDHAGEGGIWMGGGGDCVDANGDLYLATGNGIFNAFSGSGGTEYGDSLIRFTTSGGLAIKDYFAPYEYQLMSDNDLDLGSGGVLLLPDQEGPNPHLLVCGGKEGKIYLVNRDQMTSDNRHCNNNGSVDMVLQTFSIVGGSFGTPSWFAGRIYYGASGQPLVSFPVVNGLVDVNSASVGPRTFDFPGTTPTISAHGSADAIVWALQRGGGGPAVLAAYNPSNLSTEIYNSTQAAGSRDQLPVGIKFAVPVVANGKVFVGGQNSLSVFGLLQSPYSLWKNFHFGPNANNQSIAGDTADPDHDQIINVLEYAFGSDPNFTDLTKPIYGDLGSVGFELHFTRNITASDLAYTAQRANGLGGVWNAIATYNVGTGWVTNEGVSVSEDSGSGSPPDQIALVTLTDQSISVSNGNAFYRVSVGRQ